MLVNNPGEQFRLQPHRNSWNILYLAVFVCFLCILVVANMSSVEHIISLGGCFQPIYANISQPDHLLLNIGESSSTILSPKLPQPPQHTLPNQPFLLGGQ